MYLPKFLMTKGCIIRQIIKTCELFIIKLMQHIFGKKVRDTRQKGKTQASPPKGVEITTKLKKIIIILNKNLHKKIIISKYNVELFHFQESEKQNSEINGIPIWKMENVK